MIEQCACSTSSKAYQEELDEIVKDPDKRALYLEDAMKSCNAGILMIAVQDIIEAERRKFSNRLDALEKNADEIEKRIEALEQVQVTRQEFDELKARVEILEKRQTTTTDILECMALLLKSMRRVVDAVSDEQQ